MLQDNRKNDVSDLVRATLDYDPLFASASCANYEDPDAYFIDHYGFASDVPRVSAALALCESCPVKRECLLVGLSGADLMHGIRGGLFPIERMDLINPPGYGKVAAIYKQARNSVKRLRLLVAKYEADNPKVV